MAQSAFKSFKSSALQYLYSAQHYFSLTCFILLSILLFGLSVGVLYYYQIIDSAEQIVKIEGEHIEKELKDLFDDTHKIMIYIGREITKSQPEDFMRIWNQAAESFGGEGRSKKSFIWPDFGWINTQGKLIYNTKSGIFNPPKDMSPREYLPLAREFPWTLQFAKPGESIPVEANGMWVLPFATGVTNEKKDFIGILGASFPILELIKIVEETIQAPEVNFLLLDNQGNTIMQSPGEKWDDLSRSLSISHLRPIKGTPFHLITYISQWDIKNVYYEAFMHQLLIFLVGGACYLLLACFFLHNIIKKNRALALAKRELEKATLLAKNSDAVKEEFQKRVNQELKVPFSAIVTYADILLKQSRGEINLEISEEKQLEFLERIKTAAIDLETLTTHVLDLSPKDIKMILEDCLKIQAKQAFLKGMKLLGDIPAFPPMITDELRLKQIIVGLLSRAIRFSRQGGTVCVSAGLQEILGARFIKIEIKDQGFGLAEEEWQMVASSYLPISRNTEGTELELSSIKRLIHLLHGAQHIEAIWSKGTTVTLCFPYLTAEEWQKQYPHIPLNKMSMDSV